MPSLVLLIVLSAVAWRLTILVTEDAITHPLRRWATGINDEQHADWDNVFEQARHHGVNDPWEGIPASAINLSGPDVYPPIPPWRWHLSTLLRCPWCAGWWVSLGVGLVYGWQTHNSSWSESIVVGVALSGIVGVTARVTR